jgi:hypothetical protein
MRVKIVDEDGDGFGGAAEPVGKAPLDEGFLLNGDCVGLGGSDGGNSGGLPFWDGGGDGPVGRGVWSFDDGHRAGFEHSLFRA